MIKVGDKVVCVKGYAHPDLQPSLIEGQHYIIGYVDRGYVGREEERYVNLVGDNGRNWYSCRFKLVEEEDMTEWKVGDLVAVLPGKEVHGTLVAGKVYTISNLCGIDYVELVEIGPKRYYRDRFKLHKPAPIEVTAFGYPKPPTPTLFEELGSDVENMPPIFYFDATVELYTRRVQAQIDEMNAVITELRVANAAVPTPATKKKVAKKKP